MKLEELINQNFSMTDSVKLLIGKMSNELSSEDFSLTTPSISDRASTFLGIAKIQQRTTSIAAANTLGFNELILALEEIPSDELIGIGSLSSQQWDGKLHYQMKGIVYSLIGIAIVKKKEIQKLKTPPNWDGSEQILKEYNKSKKIK